ncbi:MAG TPA: ATP synthase F0 subunit C [Bryobacteraceae bacterium]|jgi:F-type H+-transporting ATPase subunit c
MKKLVLLMLALMFCAIPMFAQGGAAGGTTGGNIWVPVAAGLSMAIASGLCALGMGSSVNGACAGIARNPAAFPLIRFALIFGMALIESLALYTLVIVFVKVV